MSDPKTLEDLDKIIENQSKNRIQEYNRRKWLSVLSPYLTWGIGAFPDLINKDKKFWVVYIIILIVAGLLLLILRLAFFKS